MGAAITVAGAVITIVLNVLLIPVLHYLGAAIATFCCYFFMMVASYILGQKHYPIPYARKKLLAYLAMVVILYLIHMGITAVWTNHWFNIAIATLLFAFFTIFVGKIERKELQRMPFLQKLYTQKKQ